MFTYMYVNIIIKTTIDVYAWAWANGTQCSACVWPHGVYSCVGERHRTEGDLACAARRVLAGYSRAECRAHISAPVRNACARAQRRHACRPTSATRARPRARRTSPTQRVRAMRSARPAFPHCAHSPPFSTRHLPAALHCIALGPPPGRVTALHAPEALWHCVRLAAATAVPRGRCEVLRQCWVLSSKCPAYHRGYREWSP